MSVAPLSSGSLSKDDHQVIAAVDAETARIEEEVVGVVFAHGVEASVGRYSNGDHRLIDDAGDLLVVGQVFRKGRAKLPAYGRD
jgi:hypothetical protein